MTPGTIEWAFATGAVNSKTGWIVEYKRIGDFLKEGFVGLRPGRDAVATLGILRGTGAMIKRAQSLGIDYFLMDHAYFNPGYKAPFWLLITKNDHAIGALKEVTPERWKLFFREKNRIQPWQTNAQRGDKILICPHTKAIEWFMEIEEDCSRGIINRLQSLLPQASWSKIVVRKKTQRSHC